MSNMSMTQIKNIRRQQKEIQVGRLPALAKQRMDNAELPTLYKAAKAALQKCYRIDEVKEVKDKHEAIALYAKQTKDTTLMYYAERIKLRALERIGELLSELPKGRERDAASKAAGLAQTVANRTVEMTLIPKRVRDTMIESDPPPKYMRMAEVGLRGYGGEGGLLYTNFHHLTRREEQIVKSVNTQLEELMTILREMELRVRIVVPGILARKYSLKDLIVAADNDAAETIYQDATSVEAFIDEVLQCLGVRGDRTGASK
jgi:hypothetical protein